MRYRFIDKILALHLGEPPRIEVEKTFPPGDDAFSGPGGPAAVPRSLVLELLAMTGGHLIVRYLAASRLPLLIKVSDCRFEAAAGAGETLRAAATLNGRSRAGETALMIETDGEVHGPAGRVAAARLLYLCVSLPGVDLARAASQGGESVSGGSGQ